MSSKISKNSYTKDLARYSKLLQPHVEQVDAACNGAS